MCGEVLCPEDRGYDEARRLWNGMIDRRPLLIARCLGLTDVAETIRFARNHDVPMTVRGGGHGVSGKAVLDGAVLLDLSAMKHVHVDPARHRAVAQAGATWGDFDPKTQTYGLATTGGVISTTGIAGLTLGGGIGWLMGKHGLACDNLISVDVADASGEHLTASAEQNADLFWALRGGGGNFGVVTTFEYQLHPLSAVLGGVLLHPRQNALDLLRHYRDLTANAPDELTAYGVDERPRRRAADCNRPLPFRRRPDLSRKRCWKISPPRAADRRYGGLEILCGTSDYDGFYGPEGSSVLLQMRLSRGTPGRGAPNDR
jgi:FAD/FMN-containing dehydrogenase